MDKRSWPWKKKSSDKSTTAVPLFDSDTVHGDSARSKIEQEREEEARKPKYVQVSVDTYAHLTGLEDQVKSYEEKFQSFEEEIKDLNEKLSESHIEMTNKDNLVKQHGKVAEEAVSGWEKAEAEAAALKNHLESVTLIKITAEDRASHLDGALKECMRQIRNLKENHELKLFDVMTNNTKQFEKIKLEFESKIAALDQDLMRSAAENAALSRSLQDRSSMLIRINEEKSQAEAEIEQLKSNIESCHKEINSLTYELHVVAKEMEIRNEEKNMSVRSAEVANKQYLEGVKKIAKLEAECQRLRGLVRKKLPGPAALAQMKLEVENFGRDHGDIRFRRSAPKPSASLSEFSFDAVQNCHKENELLTERLIEMEEETKMLKEALAKRNSELQVSRSVYSKTANKLQSLEAQLQENGGHRSPPSLTSISIDDSISCDGSSATGMNIDTRHKSENTNHLELMDDFLEMEKLAYQSVDMGVIAVSDSYTSNNETYEIARNDNSENVTGEEILASEEHIGSDLPVICLPSEGENPELSTNHIRNLRSKLIVITDSLSKETDLSKTLEDLKQVLQEAKEAPSDCENGGESTEETAIISSIDDNEMTLSFSQELASSVTHIHDFVMVLGEGIKAVPTTCNDSEDLNQILTDFSTTYKEVDDSKISLIQFVSDLSQVLHKANGFYCNFLGYKISEAENANSDCIDKVVLPENKGSQDSSGDRYQIQNLDFSDSNSEADIPREGSPIRSTELTANLSKHMQEEFEQIVSEKNRLTIDLNTCIENLENTKIQLLDMKRKLSEAKSELSSAHKLNSLSETQLKCMAESYKTLETRAEELQAEVILLRTKMEGFHNELQEEKKNHQDALSRCTSLEDQLQRMESCQFADIDSRTNQEREIGDAAEKLAQCQETILLLGKQLNAMRPNTETTGPTTYNDRHKEGDFIEHVVSYVNQQGMNTEVTGPNVREPPINMYDVVPYSPDTTTTTTTTTEGNNSLYLRSPNNSNSPKHRYASTSSIPSSPIQEKEKHSRGFTRFFSAKSKNGF